MSRTNASKKRALKKARARRAQNSEPQQQARSGEYRAKAWSCLKEGKSVEAREFANRALRTDPHDPQPYAVLCIDLMLAEHFKKTAPLIDQGLRVSGDGSYRLNFESLDARHQMSLEKAQSLATEAYHRDPDNDFSFIILGDLMLTQGKYELAFPLYQTTIESGWSHPALSRRVDSCLINIRQYDEHEMLRKAALRYLNESFLAPTRISPLVSNLLHVSYGDRVVSQLSELEEASRDQLLIKALRSMLLISAHLEAFILSARRLLLRMCLKEGKIPEPFLELICAIAAQHHHTEYIYLEDFEEKTTVENLAEVIGNSFSSDTATTQEVIPLVVLFSMYRPLINLEFLAKNGVKHIEDWPPLFQGLIERTLSEPIEERRIAADIPSISKIDDTVSLEVQNQYEENPYPRWLHLSKPHQGSAYHQTLMDRFSELIPVTQHPFLEIAHTLPTGKAFEVLVAGCGTGKHPLSVALKSPEISVVAVDLSRSSLSYGKRMAKTHGVRNVQFLQGDILKIRDLGKTFHAIETAGVLHHMEDPSAGLEALRSILKPHGVLYMALYSKRARSTYVEIQNYISEQEIEASHESIRDFRGKIVRGELFSHYPELLKNQDMQSMSGIRDLLFNVQEHRFSPLEVKDLLGEHRLKFIGFMSSLPYQTATAYRDMFPDDPSMNSLDNWEIFEEHHPKTFLEMFHMCCQAIP